MSPYSLGNDKKENSLYDLFAVTNHSGTVNFGHYTSYGRLPAENNSGSVMDDGIGTVLILVYVVVTVQLVLKV